MRNDTEERNDAFQIGHVKKKRKTSAINDAHPQQRNADSLARKTTRKEHQTLPEQRNADRKRTSISAFKNGTQNNDVTDNANKITDPTARI